MKRIILILLLSTAAYAEWDRDTILRYDKVEYIIAEAAGTHDVPFSMLVGLLYTESKFRGDAKSHTGVLGIAQFTHAKALEMGVNRRDIKSSIYGAAKLLRKNYDQSIKSFSEEHRWNLACIYYNRGKAHHFKAKRALKKRGVPITYKNLIRQYKKYPYMKEGLNYIKSIRKEMATNI